MSRFSKLTAAAAVLAVAFGANRVQAQHNPPSGMLLGVYAFSNSMGLRVTGTIAGYSAEGRLFRNDVLLRATEDGQTIYPIRNHQEIERAKNQLGPGTPVAVEMLRPGIGLVYMWVEFQPVGGAAAYSKAEAGAAPRMKAEFKTEMEKPGARALFGGGNHGGVRPLPETPRKPQPGQGDAGSLFK